jgi:uncharacterized protein YecE (DUF72 family)
VKRKESKTVPFAQPIGKLFDAAAQFATDLRVDRGWDIPGVHIGTSAFTAAGWPGSFYPEGMQPRDFLSYYATKFDTVEVDSTFYRTPSVSTVNGWYEKTPPDFIFAAKVPGVVTHAKVLVDCEREFEEFVDRMDLLDDKLGPLLLQFPYFNKSVFKSSGEFLTRLRFFLKRLQGTTVRYAIEIRNKSWLDARFADLLRKRRVALALADIAYLPRPTELFEKFDPITTDFTYVRLLGDRKGIEKLTKTWDETIVDRQSEMYEWVRILRKVNQGKIRIYAYANNHYAGHGPATVEQFQKLWGPASP